MKVATRQLILVLVLRQEYWLWFH